MKFNNIPLQLRCREVGEDGERVCARRGRVGQGRDLPERRQSASSQVYRELSDRAADHNVIRNEIYIRESD